MTPTPTAKRTVRRSFTDPAPLPPTEVTYHRFLRSVRRHLDPHATLTRTHGHEKYTLAYGGHQATVRVTEGTIHVETPFVESIPVAKNRRGRDAVLAMDEMFRAVESSTAMKDGAASLEAARALLHTSAAERRERVEEIKRRAYLRSQQDLYDKIVEEAGTVGVRLMAGETYATVAGAHSIDPAQAVRVVEYLMTHVTLGNARDTLLALMVGGVVGKRTP
jgi:hypothetical protein